MPQRLNLLAFLLPLMLFACAPVIPPISTQTVAPEPAPRVIVKTVREPVDGCENIIRDYGDFSRLDDPRKREEIKALKQRINENNDDCDILRLALFHSAPGKLRQTDTTVIELLDELSSPSDRLGNNDHALVLLLRNEINQRAVVARKIGKNADLLDEARAENRQLLQRLAEVQLQLDGLKNLEENIAPE